MILIFPSSAIFFIKVYTELFGGIFSSYFVFSIMRVVVIVSGDALVLFISSLTFIWLVFFGDFVVCVVGAIISVVSVEVEVCVIFTSVFFGGVQMKAR